MSKPVKKVKLSTRDEHPPSRAWLIHQNDLRMWKELNGLNGTTSGSPEVDARLRRKFGQYKGDPTALTHFRTGSGDPVQADNASPAVQVEVPNVEPTEPFDPVEYAKQLPVRYE